MFQNVLKKRHSEKQMLGNNKILEKPTSTPSLKSNVAPPQFLLSKVNNNTNSSTNPVGTTTNSHHSLCCQQCPYVACNLSDLRRHLIVHSNEQPYHCCACEFKSKWKSDVKKHQRSLNHVGPILVGKKAMQKVIENLGLDKTSMVTLYGPNIQVIDNKQCKSNEKLIDEDCFGDFKANSRPVILHQQQQQHIQQQKNNQKRKRDECEAEDEYEDDFEQLEEEEEGDDLEEDGFEYEKYATTVGANNQVYEEEEGVLEETEQDHDELNEEEAPFNEENYEEDDEELEIDQDAY